MEVQQPLACEYTTPCDGCVITNQNFYLIMTDENRLFQFLVKHNVLPCHIECPKCKSPLESKLLCFRCRKVNKKSKRPCNFYSSTKKNTFFDSTRMTMQQVAEIVLIYLSRPPPRCAYISREVGTSNKTLYDWFFFMREVFVFWCVEHSEVLGGEGTVVEIDEAKMGKRRYSRGQYLEGQCMFSGIQRGTKRFFVVALPDRSSASVVEIIKAKILPGTTTISDCWKANDPLSPEHYEHLAVDHSVNIVDSNTSAHSQNIAKSWAEVRKLVPRCGRFRSNYESHLAECLFMWTFCDHRVRLHHFWTAVAKLHPGLVHF